MSDQAIHERIKDYYGKVLQASADLQTNACCAAGAPVDWQAALIENVHDDVLSRFYGCGFPIPEALAGAKVLDLGCGTGRDVYMLSQLVGQDGFVHGLDMTEEQLTVGRETLDWHMDRFGYDAPNVAFHKGYIEDLSELPIADGELDVVVSNCVVNLSPFKDRVLAEAYRLLKPGGEFYFSDVFADRRIPAAWFDDPVLHGECLGGAMYHRDFLTMARRIGFIDPREVSESPITIESARVERIIGNTQFFSLTYRLFKLEGLDEQCEDYGQVATYKGTLPHHPTLFALDDHHAFETNRPERICANTAAMLTDTRFAPHFTVTGQKTTHFGAFACHATMAAEQYAGVSVSGGGSGSGSCC